MANEVDLDQLTETQQAALQTYTSVTNQELSSAIPILQRSQWNVNIAITKFFDGEVPDPVEEARAAQAAVPLPSTTAFQRETLLDGVGALPRRRIPLSVTPAPRIVPQRPDQAIRRVPTIFALLFAPINILYKLLSSSAQLFTYLFPFLPRLFGARPSQQQQRGQGQSSIPLTTLPSSSQPILATAQNAQQTVDTLQETYGTTSIPYLTTSYAQAYDRAKQDLRFLLVILLSPEHDGTSTFVRETLYSETVASFLTSTNTNETPLVWLSSITSPEAYQLSTALSCTTFPFAALIAHTPQVSSTAMSIIARISGASASRPEPFLSAIQNAQSKFGPPLTEARRKKDDQRFARSLRDEQNSAYERSLAADRERTRLRREKEEEERRKVEQEKRDRDERDGKERRRRAWRRWRAAKVKSEPSMAEKDIVRISIRMRDGQRVVRRFESEVGIEEVYAFVECFDLIQPRSSKDGNDNGEDGNGDVGLEEDLPQNYEHEYAFNLVSPLPRKVYDVQEKGSTKSLLGRSGNLIVEPIVPEDEEEDGEEDEDDDEGIAAS
ncbi:hypothetical protein MMC25_004007 [Agyrium rufum]|nr:hypothetical protein [Agyrium rufum]